MTRAVVVPAVVAVVAVVEVVVVVIVEVIEEEKDCNSLTVLALLDEKVDAMDDD